MLHRLGRREPPLILCVDDDRVARMMAQLAMSLAGHHVVEADSGAAALAAFHAHLPDLVLLDVHIGDMTGFEVCAAMRATRHGASLPIVILTGDDQADTIRNAYDAGATDFVGKDVAAAILTQRVQFLLRAKTTLDDLHDSETMLEAAQRLARVGSFVWDLRTNGHVWSAVAFELLGFGNQQCEITHGDFLQAVHPDDRTAVERVFKRIQDGGERDSVEFRVWQDGSEPVLKLCAEPVRSPAGDLLGAAGSLLDITAIRQAESRIRQLAYYDAVTGLPNRILFLEQMKTALGDAGRRGSHTGVIFLDLDHFKTVNDTLGHAAGDEILKAAADRFRVVIRAADAVSRFDDEPDPDEHALGRLGGDEFVVLLRDLRRDDDAGVVATTLLRSLEAPFVVSGREVFLTASAGIALYPADAPDADGLLRHADTAMYAAKDMGRNAFRFFDPAHNEVVAKRLDVESGLRRALDRLEFQLYYQPIVDAESGEVLSGECLIRWMHPELGLIYPGQFIPVAEESGLIALVSEWVIRAACAQHRTWADHGCTVPLSFNVSSRDFQTREFAERLIGIVADAGIAPALLTIEITESVLLRQSEIALENVARLKRAGFRLSIDDFGTGYSSLNYLRRFPVSQIKVDRSFIRDIESDVESVAITEAVAMISHRLGIEPVAEGVETAAQQRILSQLGFRKMQGFLFGRPVPADAFMAMLLERRPQAVAAGG